MKEIYHYLLVAVVLSIFNSSAFSQSPACANFSGVFISDSLEQNLDEYSICPGSNIYLKSLNNPVGATFQWKKNGVNISGETNRKININAEGLYSLTMTLGTCTATSSGIIVRLFQGAFYSRISSNFNQACLGDSIMLKALKGTGITYQWKKNNLNIAGANSSIYKATTSGSFTVQLTQAGCMGTTNPVSLTFNNAANPVVSTAKSIICEGLTTVLKVTNINNTHTLQWLKDGVAISGANKDSLVVSQTGNYVLQTTKGACTGNSTGKNISVTNLNLPPPTLSEFFYGNKFQTCANNIVKIKVQDYTDGNLTWLKDGNVMAGQTSAELIARESGNYAVRYQGNTLCYAQSEVIPVKITDNSTLSFAGNDFTLPSGQSANIRPSFTGVAPIVYTVNNDGYYQLVLGPSGNYYNTSYLTASQVFSITSFANACSVGTYSGSANITIGNCNTPTNIQSVTPAFISTFCIGGSVPFRVTATGTNLTYQWQKNGAAINNATSSNFTISNFSYSDIANYTVRVTGLCGTRTSEDITLRANYGDVVFAKLDYPAYTNSDILLTAFSGSSFGNASNAYRWAGPNGFSSTEQNPVIPNGTASNSGVYTVTATNAGGCVNYALLTVTVTTAPITLGNLGTTSFCPNGTLSIPFTSTLTAGTLYKAYLSDANGNFRNQTEIGMGMTSPIEITFPQYLSAGTKYRIRIVSTSPLATSTLSGYLSTNGVQLTISVKNLIGREIEIYGGSICQGSALTGIISTNQVGVTYEWKKDGTIQTTSPTFRMTQTGNYTASVQKTGCNNVRKNLSPTFGNIAYHIFYRIGEEFQCSGNSIVFEDIYYSDSAKYLWYNNGSLLAGKTKDTIIVNKTGFYTNEIIDKCPVVESGQDPSLKKVTFSNSILSKIAIAYGSEKPILCGNTSSVYITSDNGNRNPLTSYNYQWKKNGANITNAQYYAHSANDEGLYTLLTTQGACSSLSNGIEVIKKDSIKLNLFISQPFTSTICQGLFTRLNSNILAGVSINLYKDENLIDINSLISETGKYVLRGSSPGCIVLPSDTLKITVGDKITSFLFNLTSSICTGYQGDIRVVETFSSLPNIQYQWFRNNQPLPGETSNRLQPIQSGFYKIRVISGSCSGFSDSTKVVISNLISKPDFVGQVLRKNEICENNLIILKPNNFTTYDSLFLKKNGIIIKKQDYYSTLSIEEPGIYTVLGKQKTCLSEESDPVEIKIGEPITANITGSTSIYPGQKAKLNLNFTGGNAWSYQTSDVATGQTTSNSPTLKNVNPSSTQTYSITSVASNCGVGTVTGNAIVTVLPCPTDKTISINSGNWNTNATWTCGQIPTPTLDAIIDQGHTVSLPNGYQGNAKKLELKGGIKQGVGASLRVSN